MTIVALIGDNFILAALITASNILLFHLSKAEKSVRPQTMSLVSASPRATLKRGIDSSCSHWMRSMSSSELAMRGTLLCTMPLR
jgi:hypothetical protein